MMRLGTDGNMASHALDYSTESQLILGYSVDLPSYHFSRTVRAELQARFRNGILRLLHERCQSDSHIGRRDSW